MVSAQGISVASRHLCRAPLLSLLQASMPARACHGAVKARLEAVGARHTRNSSYIAGFPSADLRLLGLQHLHTVQPAAAAGTAARKARVLDGRAVATTWQEELARDVRDVYAKGGRPPGLGVILVGSRPDSLLYVTRKREACERVGGRVGRSLHGRHGRCHCAALGTVPGAVRHPPRANQVLRSYTACSLFSLDACACRWACLPRCASCQAA